MNDVGCDPDIGIGVEGQEEVAAIGIARPARKVTAGDVYLHAAARRKRVIDIAEFDGQLIDVLRH